MFEKLKSFKEQNGHCNVPAQGNKLGGWVQNQRKRHKLNKLDTKQQNDLNQLGFQWIVQKQAKPRNKVSTGAFDKEFDSMMKRVVSYVGSQGHGWIPQSGAGDKKLGQWANNRRREKKEGTLSQERVEKLEKAGFVWNCSGRKNAKSHTPVREEA